MHACAFCFCLGVSCPFTSDTSPKRIDREGLGKRRIGTRQSCSDVITAPLFLLPLPPPRGIIPDARPLGTFENQNTLDGKMRYI